MSRPRVALLHPLLDYGGSERFTLSIAEALQEDYEVALITTSTDRVRVDFDRLNRFCETAVDKSKVPVREVLIPEFLRTNFAALRGGIFSRFCRRLVAEFDVMFMTYGVMDFGVRGIQLIHDPLFSPELHRQLTPFPRGLRGWFYRDSPLRKAYLGLSQQVAGYSEEGMKNNLTLVSSEWTGRIVRQCFGIETRTVYPPVAGKFPEVAWSDREDGFVCAGRWSLEKRMERVVRILGEVRKRGAKIHLHLVGTGGDPRYVESLRQLCRENREWVYMEDGIDSPTKSQMMAGHKYGLSGRENEPFGIAVAEMVKAGGIVFVPNGGGQVEIVNHPALIYEDDADAVRKIEAVLANAALQGSLREHLSQGAQRFSVERFREAIRDVVSEFLRDKRTERRDSTQDRGARDPAEETVRK
jgi:glycosyltransferase involved in cell wall biosynthesis